LPAHDGDEVDRRLGPRLLQLNQPAAVGDRLQQPRTQLGKLRGDVQADRVPPVVRDGPLYLKNPLTLKAKSA
jgi:hypothetical protein